MDCVMRLEHHLAAASLELGGGQGLGGDGESQQDPV